MKTKDSTWWAVLRAAIELDVTKGHLKWRLTDLSRKSGVSRSLIYYYFGRDRASILIEAIKLFGEFMAGTDKLQMRLWDQRDYAEALFEARKIIKRTPYLMVFYFLNRESDTEIGKMIRMFERKGVQKRKLYNPKFDDRQAAALFALQMGISLSPQLHSIQDFRNAVEMIKP